VEANEGLRQASDFFGVYQGGSNLYHGHSIYDSEAYRHQAPLRVPFYYYYRYLPPTAYLSGLAALVVPPWPAYWIWVILCEGILFALVVSTLRQREWPLGRRQVVATLWLGAFPFYLEQVMGQFSIVMAAFLWMLWRYDPGRTEAAAPDAAARAAERDATATAAERASERPRSSAWLRGPGTLAPLREILRRWTAYRWSADTTGNPLHFLAWVGSLSLKSFSALLAVPYLRDRRLKRVLYGAGATVILSAPYFLSRPGDLREFLRLNFTPFTPALHKGSFGFHNLLRDLLFRIDIPALTTLHPVGPLQLNALGGLLLAAFAAIGLVALWVSLRLLDHPNRTALDLALWTTAFFLVFKSVWEYHYVMLLPAVAALYLTTGSRFVLAMGVLFVLPTLYGVAPALAGIDKTAPIESWPAGLAALHLSVKSLPTLALFGWCVREAGRQPTGTRSSRHA
jgi:hypothetical protein